MTVIIGVDGSGRTHRLAEVAGAAGRDVTMIGAADDVDAVRTAVESARVRGLVLAVDDAHRLDDDVLRVLTVAAQQAVPVVITRRPGLAGQALVALDEAVTAASMSVEVLEPLDAHGVAALIRHVRGTAPDTAEAERILADSAGLPAIAAALAAVQPTLPGAAVPAIVVRTQQRLARAGGAAARVCRVLALDVQLSDAVLCDATGASPDELAAALRELGEAGLTVAGGHRLVPAVAAAIRHQLSPVERRLVHRNVADALVHSGAGPVSTATQLRAAGIRTPVAADAFRNAGERLRLTDPETALAWYDDAADAGAAPETLAAGRAEAAVLLGRPIDLEGATDERTGIVIGAAEAHQGRGVRAVDALSSAGPVGRMLAVPTLVGLGRIEQATEIEQACDASRPLRRFAEAAIAAVHPHQSIPKFVEAAEVVEQVRPELVLPDTPHALGAIVAVSSADVRTAERLLLSALDSDVGGPAAADRHRLLLGWARMRTGRYETALKELRRTAGRPLPGRERLLRASLAAGIARRSGDVATLRDMWEKVDGVLVRGGIDLYHVELVEELVVAAARLGRPQRAEVVLPVLDEIIERLGSPATWASAMSWTRVQCAVATDDSAAVRRVASSMADRGLNGRAAAQAEAAACWGQVLAGDVDHQAVVAAVDSLDAAELPWEASRLAGQAAIRTVDPDTARQLLERARGFTHQPAGDDERLGQLSDREVQVARLVQAGRTYKEIGAQLYLSPKTVEHHVARIRTKVGAESRAELLAALRKLLHESD